MKWPALIIGILLLLEVCHRAPSRTAINRDKLSGFWIINVAVLGLTRATLLDEMSTHFDSLQRQ